MKTLILSLLPLFTMSQKVEFTNGIPICPECKKPTARSGGGSSITCMAYMPIYDKNGNNTNPDRNIITSGWECHECGCRYETKGNYTDGFNYGTITKRPPPDTTQSIDTLFSESGNCDSIGVDSDQFLVVTHSGTIEKITSIPLIEYFSDNPILIEVKKELTEILNLKISPQRKSRIKSLLKRLDE